MIIMQGLFMLLPLHLLVLAYLLLCIAIVPWPRERAIRQSGFEVVIPDRRSSA